MHADNPAPQQQAGRVLEQLVQHPTASAQAVGEQQGDGAGENGDDDRYGERSWREVGVGAGAHGGHAHVMHGGDTYSDTDRGADVLPGTRLGMAQGVHGQEGGDKGNQQRKQGNRQVVVEGNRRLERQHADEMHGPDPAGQAAGSDPAPTPLGTWVFGVADPLGYVQRGKTGCAGDQVGQQHQHRVVATVEYDLTAACGQFAAQMPS